MEKYEVTLKGYDYFTHTIEAENEAEAIEKAEENMANGVIGKMEYGGYDVSEVNLITN